MCHGIIVGPNTYFPLNAFSRKQTVTSMSSTEAEVVAANQSLRAEGIPILALFEQLKIFQQDGETARGDAVPKIVQEGILAKIDHEIDEIRNGTWKVVFPWLTSQVWWRISPNSTALR